MKNRLSSLVGDTPLLPIHINEDYCIHGKAEFMNPSGSVKDRMATYILDNAEKNGLIKPGDTLCEATSGNTGIAFAMLAAERGYTLYIVMPCNMSDERKQMLKFYNARLIEVDEGDFDGAIQLRDEMCEKRGWFNCNQFHNDLNIEAHFKNTGLEIVNQYNDLLLPNPNVFICGTGTGGTIMGVSRRIKTYWPKIKIVAVEPSESPVMSGGEPGLHGIQGIGDGSKFLVDLDYIDEVVTISTDDAKIKAKELATQGLFVGISAGANVLAAEKWLHNNCKKGGNAITILCDRGERYLSCL
jgi:cysteine synthase A